MDYVFHLAADKDYFGGQQVFDNNMSGTEALLESLQGSQRLKRLVFTISMGALDRSPGDKCVAPLDEESPPNPTSPYGRAKYLSERLIEQSSLPYTILRLPWCYGPGMTPGTHVRTLTEMVMRGRLATRFNWPGRVSLIEVAECVRALAFVASQSNTLQQVLFVCDGDPIPIGTLLREIGRSMGRKAATISIPATVQWLTGPLLRILPFSVKSLFLDALWVDDRKLRAFGFNAASRKGYFPLPLVPFINQQKNPSLHRSKALVTGAASGIGYALSVQLSARGQRVIMVDRDPKVAKLAIDIPGAEATVANLASEDGLANVISLVESSCVSCVVNCAGLGLRSDVGSTKSSSLTTLLAVNIHALTQLSEAAIRNFRSAGEGLLVNISSSAGFQPLPGLAAYGASKTYVLSFSEALAGENENPAITVLTVCPSSPW